MNAALRSQPQGIATASAERTDALVISNDDSFLVELGPLIGDRYRVHAVDTPAGISDRIGMARWIGIVDVDSQVGARGAVSHLELQHPSCPLILITARPEDWVASVERGAVLATIARGRVATAELSEMLLAAEDHLRVVGAEELHTGGPSALPGRFDLRPPRRGSAWAGAATLLLVLAASGVYLHHRLAPALPERVTSASDVAAGVRVLPATQLSPIARGAAGSSAAASPLAARTQSVLELLSAARVAFHDQRLLPPRADAPLRGDSALELYAQVLRQDPKDDEAVAGVKRLLVIGRDRIMSDVASGKLDDASRLLGVFDAAGANAGDLRPLASAISAARPNWLAQRAGVNIAAGDFDTADQLLAEGDGQRRRRCRHHQGGAVPGDRKNSTCNWTAIATQIKAAIQAGALLPPAMDNAHTLEGDHASAQAPSPAHAAG